MIVTRSIELGALDTVIVNTVPDKVCIRFYIRSKRAKFQNVIVGGVYDA